MVRRDVPISFRGGGFASRDRAWAAVGTLVGVVAALIYLALTRAQPEPAAYILAHALKLVGGACGGWAAERRRSPSPPKAVDA